MNWHVFVVLHVFFCVLFLCNAGNILPAAKFKNLNRVNRVKRSPQVGGDGNIQITGISLPDIASGIRKGIHDVIDSIRNPTSIDVIMLDSAGNPYGDRPADYRENNPQMYPTNYVESSPPYHGNHPPHSHGHHPPRDNEHHPPHSHGRPPPHSHGRPPPHSHGHPPPHSHDVVHHIPIDIIRLIVDHFLQKICPTPMKIVIVILMRTNIIMKV